MVQNSWAHELLRDSSMKSRLENRISLVAKENDAASNAAEAGRERPEVLFLGPTRGNRTEKNNGRLWYDSNSHTPGRREGQARRKKERGSGGGGVFKYPKYPPLFFPFLSSRLPARPQPP
jgi:hypothetical protein